MPPPNPPPANAPPGDGIPAENSTGVKVRDAGWDDMDSICRIYAHHVRYGFGTSESDAPEASEMARRASGIRELCLPYLVATAGSRIIGFAFAGPFRPRPAYRSTLEDSVYVDPDGLRQGVGSILLSSLIGRCEVLGCRQMVAMIGDRDNLASIRLHAACGFSRAGTLDAVFFKNGRWVDVVIMQRALGAGDRARP